MPTYKLTYFPLRARGETIRLVFAQAGVAYEDNRINFDDWPNHKQKQRFRQLPVLEVDGKQLAQSYAIVRYLANEFGLAGKDSWDATEADQFMGAVEDLFIPTTRVFFEKDEAIKAENLTKLQETAPSFLQAIDDALAKSQSGYLVSSGLTYADLGLFSLQEFMESTLKEDCKAIYAKYTNIHKHRQKIQSLPNIAAWLKKRPEANF